MRPMVHEEPLTDKQQDFLKRVERGLREAKAAKLNGELEFKALIRDGGIMDAYKTVRTRETT